MSFTVSITQVERCAPTATYWNKLHSSRNIWFLKCSTRNNYPAIKKCCSYYL